MFLHGETGARLRRGAAVLVMAILGWAGLVGSAGAANARHYEQVSPAAKGGGDIVGDGDTVVAARLGDAVAFSTRSPFGDEIGSGAIGQTTYVARRGAESWTSHAATPMSQPAGQTPPAELLTKLEIFSDDLTRGIVWGYDLPGGGGTPARGNVYAEDIATRSVQALAVSQADPLSFFDFLPVNEVDWGVSADAQHVALVTGPPFFTRLTPDAASGASNVYQWDAGRGLSLAGILPDGTVPTGGSSIQSNYRRSMSADGSRLVFTAAPNGVGELYERIDGSMTVPISNPPGTPEGTSVILQAVTPDGRNVFFVTDSGLVSGDTNGGPDLYRWTDSGDAAHDGTLTPITTSGDLTIDSTFLGPSDGVVGVSDDGTRVYYQTRGNQLVAWDNGTSRVINSSAAADANPLSSLAALASRPGLGRVSSDGMWLAFVTSATLGTDGVHAIAPDLAGDSEPVTNGHYEMYVYSLRDDRLVCVSCSSTAATSDAAVTPDVTSGTPSLDITAVRPQFLSDAGQVFFSTSDALLPEDVNGSEDVYEYDASSGLRLVSTGTGKAPASFADASANGSDVFIETRQQLASGDRDNLVDLYDATTRPALAAAQQQPVQDCQGDSCQPPPAGRPPEDLFGSLSLDGSGNSASAVKALTIPGGVTAHGSVASVRVRLGVAGTLSWHGRGVLSGSVRHGSGSVTVRVRLDRRARAQLKKKGRYVTRVRLTLIQKDRARVSGVVRVTFRAAAKKGR